jgi:hypothetical protein
MRLQALALGCCMTLGDWVVEEDTPIPEGSRETTERTHDPKSLFGVNHWLVGWLAGWLAGRLDDDTRVGRNARTLDALKMSADLNQFLVCTRFSSKAIYSSCPKASLQHWHCCTAY